MSIQTLTTIRHARAHAGRYRNGAARVLTKIQRGWAIACSAPSYRKPSAISKTRLAHERLFPVETEWRRHHDAAKFRIFIPRNRDGRQSVVNAGDTTGGRTSH